MTPPEAPATGNQAGLADSTPAVSVCLQTMRKRSDFLRAARGLKKPMPGFLLQGRKRAPDETNPDIVRVGFTCSKKVGNAVARNRAKRRLREAARLVLSQSALPGWDYVLVGRAEMTATLPFEVLVKDLRKAVSKLHAMQP